MYYIFFLFRQLSLSLSPPISYFGNTIAKNQTIFFFFFLLFWQCHCHKLIATIFFFPPISPMALPQIHCHNSFSLLFRQCHCHKPIVTIFFSLLFRQYHCHKSIATFFFFLLEKWYVHTIADMGGRFLVYMAGNFILILSNGFRLIELLSVE